MGREIWPSLEFWYLIFSYQLFSRKTFFFLSFRLVKWNFATLALPEKILLPTPWKIPQLPPLEKKTSDAHDWKPAKLTVTRRFTLLRSSALPDMRLPQWSFHTMEKLSTTRTTYGSRMETMMCANTLTMKACFSGIDDVSEQPYITLEEEVIRETENLCFWQLLTSKISFVYSLEVLKLSLRAFF